MLTGIGLRNFKAFGDEMQEAPLSKITLIYGPNSGGKSSIIQALLLLKQSLKNDYGETRELIPRGEFADLGSIQSLMHNHEIARNLSISLGFTNVEQGEDCPVNRVQVSFAGEGETAGLSSASYEIAVPSNACRMLESRLNPTSIPFAWDAQIRILDRDFRCYAHLLENTFLPFFALSGLADVRKNVLGQERELSEELRKELEFHEQALDAQRHAVNFQDPEPEYESSLERFVEASSLVLATQEKLLRVLARIVSLGGAGAHAASYKHSLTQEIEKRLQEVEIRNWELELRQRNSVVDENQRVRAVATRDALEKVHVRVQALIHELDSDLRLLELTSEQVIFLTPENIPQDYERHLGLIDYLAPIRRAPERLYRLSSIEGRSVGIQGEFSANVLFQSNELKDSVNCWFEQFKIPYELDAVKLGEASLPGEHITVALYILDDQRKRIKDNQGRAVSVTIADVGFGINQILPVIIEGIASEEGSIICVEQPEIHLHPRLQANIADLMIDSIDDVPGKQKQWIVETHSELLILRLQRRIREGKIKPEDISVLYVDPNDNSVEGSAIKVLRLGEDSYFKDPWPDGFFDEGLRERLPDDDELQGADDDTNILDKLFSE